MNVVVCALPTLNALTLHETRVCIIKTTYQFEVLENSHQGCGFILGRTGQHLEPNDRIWRNGPKGLSRCDYNCDFQSIDIQRKGCLEEECCELCIKNPRCTHFPCSKENGVDCI